MSGVAARGYSWPPASVANRLALKHGADSEREVTPVAEALAVELVQVAPWCQRAAFAPAVAAWSRAEAQVQLVMAWLDHHGLLDDGGEPRRAATYLLRLEASAAHRRSELGLTPTAFAKLLASLEGRPEAAGEREAMLAEAQAIIDAREVDA